MEELIRVSQEERQGPKRITHSVWLTTSRVASSPPYMCITIVTRLVPIMLKKLPIILFFYVRKTYLLFHNAC